MIITTSRKKTLPKECKQCNSFDVLRLWCDLPYLLVSSVTSLNNKLEEVITDVYSYNLDVAAITEAWHITPDTYNITGYQQYHGLRTDKRGAG